MSRRGFTLVEVLVALFIVALGMAALLSAVTTAADTTAYLREKSFAEWVAMNRIAELRLQVQPPAAGKSSGEVEFAGRRWRWEQEVAKLEIPGTQRIDVRVRPEDSKARSGAWVASVIGITGDAIAPPDGRVLPWWVSSRAAAPGPRGEGGGGERPETEPDPADPLGPSR